MILYWTFLVTQLIKNLPAMWETWVQSVGWEDPLVKGKATHSSILAWRIPWSAWGRKESDTTKQLSLHFMILHIENPKDAARKLLELINEFDKVSGYKINTQKPCIPIY